LEGDGHHGADLLVLSRKPDDSIVIADDIRVTVISVTGKQVRLGIDAPSNIAVHREEIYLKIEEENKRNAAAKGLADDTGDDS